MAFWNRHNNKKSSSGNAGDSKHARTFTNEQEPDEDMEEGSDEGDDTDFYAGKIEKAASMDMEEEEQEYEIVEREILPAKIVCPDCGGITLEGLEFCDKCGGELQ